MTPLSRYWICSSPTTTGTHSGRLWDMWYKNRQYRRQRPMPRYSGRRHRIRRNRERNICSGTPRPSRISRTTFASILHRTTFRMDSATGLLYSRRSALWLLLRARNNAARHSRPDCRTSLFCNIPKGRQGKCR